MKVRDATPADLAFIVAANTALAAETEGQALDQGLLGAGVEAVLADPRLGRYYMAERNGQVLGQLMSTFERRDWRNGLFLWIQSVYGRLAMHRSNYGVLKVVYRGPESHEEASPC
jgi:hypothetical protein